MDSVILTKPSKETRMDLDLCSPEEVPHSVTPPAVTMNDILGLDETPPAVILDDKVIDETPVLQPLPLQHRSEQPENTSAVEQNNSEENQAEIYKVTRKEYNVQNIISQQQSPVKLWKLRNFQTILGKIAEKNVTFCIDTSGSMYNCLQVVKDHIIESLFQKASEETDHYFNLVEFSTQVTQWSDKQVCCTPQTVAVAARWISNLQATTGTNVLDALLSAFSDHKCDGVCLVTDGKPDQHPSEILDNVAYVSQNRPVHCYYIQSGEPDQSSVEFLQDLAMETYGSFHIIAVSQTGAIERVAPVYRAETSAEKIIRTTQGTVYPSAYKTCSVSTTLNHPPNVYIESSPDIIVQEVDPWYPFLPYPYYAHGSAPYRRYFHYDFPYQGAWSKWRPAKAWSKFTKNLSDAAQMPPPAPGPGAMLIGTKVLARRNADGYFYIGSVKSQVMYDKFLVEFGPCKHGKYKDTSYQETFVYDMVSHADALRHSVVPGDKVLGPWEPEGERYAPGLVLDGQEKRMAEGGGEDTAVVINFHNGKTATVASNIAVWIPNELYERIKFELQLPANVRQEFADQDHYPEMNEPGYPTSGTKADPRVFEHHDPTDVKRVDPFLIERGIYNNPYYVPMYPVYYKYQPRPSAVDSHLVDEMVPGVDLTKDQLNEKVMSQLMEHKMLLEEREEADEKERLHRARLLHRRQKIEENTLKKHVSFRDREQDALSDIEAELYSGDLEMRDSGHGSATDLELENLEDENRETRNVAVGTKSLYPLPRRRRSRSPCKPRWKYWGNESAPELIEPMHFGPYRVGPYDTTVAAAPLELRDKRVSKDEMSWNSTLYQYVDPYAKYKPGVTVKDSMGYIPVPPGQKPEKQGPGLEFSDRLGEHQREKDIMAQGRLDFRRQQFLAREKGLHDRRDDERAMKQIMRDQHKQQILAQLEHEKSRHLDEMQRVEKTREAKKQINTQIRIRIEANQEREHQREEQRDLALQNRRARREEILVQRQRELEEVRLKRQTAKEERAQVRHQAVTERLNEQEAMKASRDIQARQAKINRIEHFRNLEETNQQMKNVQRQQKDYSNAVFRSTLIS